ncbi:predicted protein [Botrytis cinerea T4]|uniref:Uncharacterized protein n=1 Tax=Botryotinia fuckeliana (strain T4) TaxID=999810 RepID=G2Y4Y1_BOTF4|nr:predicted protein [Botrytis cinerea T4]
MRIMRKPHDDHLEIIEAGTTVVCGPLKGRHRAFLELLWTPCYFGADAGTGHSWHSRMFRIVPVENAAKGKRKIS